MGRNRESKRFGKLLKSKKSEFAVMYGRRRVGKTYFIQQYFNNTFDFRLSGLANSTTEDQLLNFNNKLNKQSDLFFDKPPKDWIEAFERLIKHIETIKDDRKKVIFIDELPWLDTVKSKFITALEGFWNAWATYRNDIFLVACGSAASWMINELIKNKGGLHNRVTARFKLEPFNLFETEQFLQSKNIILNRYDIIQIYMLTGGIPFYLEVLEKGKSAAQIIEELAFRKNILLQNEYKVLFHSLFKKAENHQKIVEVLSKKRIGFTRKEILSVTKLKSSGTFTTLLSELEESGFIKSYNSFGKKKKDIIYRLNDFYCAFYFKFIKDNTNFEEGVWKYNAQNATFKAWSGYAFEQVCLSHIKQIKKALGIAGMLSYSHSWKYKDENNGAQIDLLLDRNDKIINICEIKYAAEPFVITKEIDKNLRNKIAVFKAATKTKKTIFTTFITPFGLLKNKYSNSIAQSEILVDALFEDLK